jgi:hypothetical protein
VYNPCRVKTIRIAASSVMDIRTPLLLLLVSVTHDFYLPLEYLPARGQLRCKERESSHRLGVLEGVRDRESGMPEEPESGMKGDV